MKIITALLNPDDTIKTIRNLTEHGFRYDNLSLMSSVSEMPNYLAGDSEESAATGAIVGATTGGTVGALSTAVASTIPGFEAMFVSGLITTAVGTVIGGYLGSLYNVRADDQTKIDVHEALEAGQILLVAKVEEDADVSRETAVSLLEQSGGQNIETHTISQTEIENA